MCLQFGFVIFWRKDFGAKPANKMLVKLTPGPQVQAFGQLVMTLLHWSVLQKELDNLEYLSNANQE